MWIPFFDVLVSKHFLLMFIIMSLFYGHPVVRLDTTKIYENYIVFWPLAMQRKGNKTRFCRFFYYKLRFWAKSRLLKLENIFRTVRSRHIYTPSHSVISISFNLEEKKSVSHYPISTFILPPGQLRSSFSPLQEVITLHWGHWLVSELPGYYTRRVFRDLYIICIV